MLLASRAGCPSGPAGKFLISARALKEQEKESYEPTSHGVVDITLARTSEGAGRRSVAWCHPPWK